MWLISKCFCKGSKVFRDFVNAFKAFCFWERLMSNGGDIRKMGGSSIVNKQRGFWTGFVCVVFKCRETKWLTLPVYNFEETQ